MGDLISVIVPFFNCSKYIRECIESIIHQTYTNLEIILVDDGSSDDSFDICNSYNDRRIRLYKNGRKGLSFSRQYGIDRCNGKFFVTIDGDDWILPSYISKLHDSIITNNSDIAVCDRFDFYKKKMKPMSRSMRNASISSNMLVSRYRSICKEYGLSDSWDKMYRTDFVRRSGVKFSLPQGFNGNDLLFNYKLVLHCPSFSFVNEPLLMHRLTPGSMVRSANKPMIDSFEYIIKSIKEECDKCFFPEQINVEISKIFGLFMYISFLYYANYSKQLKKDIVAMYERYTNIMNKSGYLSFVRLEMENEAEVEVYKMIERGEIKRLISCARIIRLKKSIKSLICASRL